MNVESNTPLAIATLALAAGGRIGICRLPGRFGGLDDDTAAIGAWAPGVVLSMTEQAEMDAAGAGDLGCRLETLGIDWLHMPIRDFGAPEAAETARWPALADRLHACLDAGSGVLIHCKGGRGRSGMVALRLLVERGEKPDAALVRLRAVRPGAVETDAQFAWASGGARRN